MAGSVEAGLHLLRIDQVHPPTRTDPLRLVPRGRSDPTGKRTRLPEVLDVLNQP